MAVPILELDAAGSGPNGENPGSAYTLTNTTTQRLLVEEYPSPEVDAIYAEPVDEDGDLLAHQRHRNRIGQQITVRFAGSSDSNLEALIYAFSQKVEKIRREGGTLKRTTPAGNAYILDLLPGGVAVPFTKRFMRSQLAEVTWRFNARPYWRGAAGIQLSDHVQAGGPSLIWTESSIKGDVAGIGSLLVDDDSSTADCAWVTWGLEVDKDYTFTTSSGSGALFYEAESRTPLGGASVVTGPTGAGTGGSNNVVRHAALTTSYVAILSTQASGGGAHLSHVGTFRVYARVQLPATAAGGVTVALAWGVGDLLTFQQNSGVTVLPGDGGTWRMLDLGLITIPVGATRWEGRVIAKVADVTADVTATGNFQIDIDNLFFRPTHMGGEVSAVTPQLPVATAFTARDEFDQTAGNLTGKTLPIGGPWGGAGDADDFAVETSGRTAQRSAVSDTGPRFATAGSTVLTTTFVSVDLRTSTDAGVEQGVVFRYDSTSVYGAAVVRLNLGTATLSVRSGSSTIKSMQVTLPVAIYYRLSVTVDSQGRVAVWFGHRELPLGPPVLRAQSSLFATGGANADGLAGIYDYQASASAAVRNYDNFVLAVPPVDAAIYASQSMRLTSETVEREDSSGAAWARPRYEGDLLKVPPAGLEGRQSRWFLMAARHDPAILQHAYGDLSARLTYTPRYVVVPTT